MEVKIGYRFAFMLTTNLLTDSTLAFGLIITLPTPGHLMTLNLPLGLPDFISKTPHDTKLAPWVARFYKQTETLDV